MLDDDSVIDTENIHDGKATIAGAFGDVCMKPDEISFGPTAQETRGCLEISSGGLDTALETGDEAGPAVLDARVMLDVAVGQKLPGLLEIMPIERQVVEFQHRLPVTFLLCQVAGNLRGDRWNMGLSLRLFGSHYRGRCKQ